MEITVRTKQREYPVYVEHGVLSRAGSLIQPQGRAFIVSDTGVPAVWKELLSAQLPDAEMFVFEQGEANKTLRTYEALLTWLAGKHASRKDMIIGLGGGVVLDLAGFAAATYMRGISYVNIPTTALSQVDSSVGGKTAVDLNGLKNLAGAFHQPTMVIADTDTLSTLPPRQLSNGLAEAVKCGLIRDPGLFEIFEGEDPLSHLDEIIYRSLVVKRDIVEEDENETSIRKLLNFGHTYGHAFETNFAGEYLHGECVAMGMMKVLDNESIRSRLAQVLSDMDLPAGCSADGSRITEIIRNDKKAAGDRIDIVQVDEIGKGYIKTVTIDEIRRSLI